jgi:iron complex outermembrane receptor protein
VRHPERVHHGLEPEPAPGRVQEQDRRCGLEPRWVNGLDINLDWYSYKITNMIIEDNVDRILRDCYVLGNASRCGSVKRAADTTSPACSTA